MIYTLTLNPSIDYTVYKNEFRIGEINRVAKTSCRPGGKGINVSIVLKSLGTDSCALGLVGGTLGEMLTSMVESYNVRTDFIKQDVSTRINVKIIADVETQINPITYGKSAEHQIYEKLERLEKGDMLIAGGSIPEALPTSIYGEITSFLREKGVETIVDASGLALRGAVSSRPFMITPNREELSELAGEELDTIDKLAKYLRANGGDLARYVVVTLGAEGACMYNEYGEWIHVEAPKGKAVNTVGAGDSFLAGFVHSYTKWFDIERALREAVEIGSRAAFSEWLPIGEKGV